MKAKKGALVTIMLLAATLLVSARDVTMVTNTYFQNGVITSVAFDAPGALDIYTSTESRIEVTMNSAYMNKFQITLEKGVLIITFKGSKNVGDLNLKVKAYVAGPLTKIEGEKSAQIRCNNPFSGQNLNISLDEASTMSGLSFNGTTASISVDGASQLLDTSCDVGILNIKVDGSSKAIFKGSGTKEINAKINGASNLELSPGTSSTTQKMSVNVSGSSNAKLDNIMANTGKVEVDGSSSCWVWITDKASYKANGASKIFTKGTTSEVNTSVAESSEIIKQ